MAFFSSKKNKDNVAKKSVSESVKTSKVAKVTKKVETKVEAPKVALKTVATSSVDFSHDIASVIVRPHVTEKATMSSEKGVYVFEVSKDSTKNKIAKAISVMYKVTPEKVCVVNLPAKSVFVRGKWGEKTAIKKAYVYLKKGDKIEII